MNGIMEHWNIGMLGFEKRLNKFFFALLDPLFQNSIIPLFPLF
jgi:hypothetical protein